MPRHITLSILLALTLCGCDTDGGGGAADATGDATRPIRYGIGGEGDICYHDYECVGTTICQSFQCQRLECEVAEDGGNDCPKGDYGERSCRVNATTKLTCHNECRTNADCEARPYSPPLCSPDFACVPRL